MNDKKIMAYLLRVVIAWFGSIAIISVLTSRIETNMSAISLGLWTLIVTFVTVFLMYQNKKIKIARFVILGLVAVNLLLHYQKLINGVRLLIDDYETAIQVYGYSDDSGMDKVLNPATDASKTYTVVMIMLLMAAVISIIVVYTRSMLMGLILVLPVYVLLLNYNIMPPMGSFIVLIIFLFGISGLEKNENNSAPALIAMGVSLVVSLFCLTIFPESNFKKLDIFLSMNNYITLHYSEVFNTGQTEQIVASGGLSNGELGSVDAIEYTHEALVTVNTVKSDSTQYFAEFYGQTYSDNAWSVCQDNENVTEQLMNLTDANFNLQNILDGYTGNYYNLFRKYDAVLRYSGSQRLVNKEIYANELDNYQVFQNLANESTNYYKTKDYNNSDIMTEPLYSVYEQQYRQIVYNTYLQVPDDVREVIEMLMGQVTVNSLEQKEYYMEYVKDYLAENYTYSTEPGRVPDNQDFATYFLMVNKKGYCSYFATAAVLMYRCAGIPARYVEGYVLPTTVEASGLPITKTITRYNGDGTEMEQEYETYDFSLDDSCAHAWVEVYMDGYGWVTQEVTPSIQQTWNSATGALTNSEASVQSQDSEALDSDTTSATEEQQDDDQIDAQQNTQNDNESETTSQGSQNLSNSSQTSDSENADADSEDSNSTDSNSTDSNSTDSNSEDSDSAGSDSSGLLSLQLYSTEDELSDSSANQDTGAYVGVYEKGEWLLKNVGRFIPISLLFLLLIAVAGIAGRYRLNCRRRNAMYRSTDPTREHVLLLYQSLERLLNRTAYKRQEGMDFEQYANDMETQEEFLQNEEFARMTDIVLRVRFGQDQQVTEDEIRLLRTKIPKIRQHVYQKQKWYYKLILKYIYVV